MKQTVGYIVGVVGFVYLVGSWRFNNRTLRKIEGKFYQLDLRCDDLFLKQSGLDKLVTKDCVLREEDLNLRLNCQEGTTKSLWNAYDELRKNQIALEQLFEKLRREG